MCKNKIERLNYICPKCLALYCVKCSDALSNLENVCWVCNGPIDKTRPVKRFKPKEEEIKIQNEKKNTSKKFKKDFKKKI